MAGGPQAGRVSDRRYGEMLIVWGIGEIGLSLILPALFGSGPVGTLTWSLIGVVLIIVGGVLFLTGDREEEDDP